MVRVPEFEDIFVDGDEEILVSKRTDRWVIPKPILTMQKFEEDPLGEIRKVFEEFKEPGFFEDRKLAEYRMKQAIVKTMERVEGK